MRNVINFKLIILAFTLLLSQRVYSQDEVGQFLQEKQTCQEKPIDWNITFANTTFVGSALEAKADKYKSVLGDYNISFTPPQGYDQIDLRGRDRILPVLSEAGIVDLRYFIGYESTDNTAVILFPYFKTGSTSAIGDALDRDKKYYIERELRLNAQDPELDITPLVKVISELDMTSYANADTAIVYYFDLFPNTELYLGSYNNCVGLYLQKKGFPALPLKVLFTDKAKGKEMQFIRDLLSSIRYGDSSLPDK